MTLNEWIQALQAFAEQKGGDIEVRSEETDGEPWAYLETAVDIATKQEREVLYIG